MNVRILVIIFFIISMMLTCNRESKEELTVSSGEKTNAVEIVVENEINTNNITLPKNLVEKTNNKQNENTNKIVLNTENSKETSITQIFTNQKNTETKPVETESDEGFEVSEEGRMEIEVVEKKKAVEEKVEKTLTISAEKSDIDFVEKMGFESEKNSKKKDVTAKPLFQPASRIELESKESVYEKPMSVKKTTAVEIKQEGPFVEVGKEQNAKERTQRMMVASASGGLLVTLILLALLI